METKPKILVTGATGFLASRLIFELLSQGYTVRGTVRDLNNGKKLAPLKLFPNAKENLELVKADLLDDKCWDLVVKGCSIVHHTASPFPINAPKNENDIIKPAVQGTLNVLKACTTNKVQTVVFTSSTAAIASYGKMNKVHYTEDDWATLATCPAYQKSKTLAEQEAWKYYKTLDPSTRFKMTSINPTLILGPTLVNTDFTSGDIVRQLMIGAFSKAPRVMFTVVDVRDVAHAHIAAMKNPDADGKRYILDSGTAFWMKDMCAILRKEYAHYGYKIPTEEMKYCFIKFGAIFSKQAESIIPLWNVEFYYSNEKAKKDLGISFIPGEVALLEMAKSLIANGVVPDKISKKAK
jgi:nucleoside-diphosphate-sugar epimerase